LYISFSRQFRFCSPYGAVDFTVFALLRDAMQSMVNLRLAPPRGVVTTAAHLAPRIYGKLGCCNIQINPDCKICRYDKNPSGRSQQRAKLIRSLFSCSLNREKIFHNTIDRNSPGHTKRVVKRFIDLVQLLIHGNMFRYRPEHLFLDTCHGING